MKKVLAMLLALSAVCLSLAACGEKTPALTSGTDVSQSAEPAVTDEIPELPDPATLGYSGEFKILVSGNYARNDFQADGSDGSTSVELAIYRRNELIKEKYGMEIVNEDITRFGSSSGSGDGYKKIYSDYMAGYGTYDAAMIGTYDVAALAYGGYIRDLNSTPYIDLSKSYWDQKANKDLAIKGRMYYTTGDISVVDNMITHALLFNKDMIAEYGLANPYELVKEDRWTLETFGSLVKAVGQDIDNNGIYDENDLYGLLTWNDPMLAILASSGEKICSIDENGQLALTFYNERVLNLYDQFEGIVFDQAHAYNYQYDNVTGTGTPSAVWNTNRDAIFTGNRAVFYLNTVVTAERYRDSDLDFGVLPYPKLDAEQAEYGHNVSPFHAQFLCIPLTVENAERSGIIIEELAYQGKQLLTPAYYDQTLVGKTVRDEESAAMLDIIFATRVFDVGAYYNIGTYKDQLGRLFTSRAAISSMYESYKNAAEAKIAEINEIFAMQNTAAAQ